MPLRPRRIRTRFLAGAVVLTALLATGCSPQEKPGRLQPPPTPTTTTAAARGVSSTITAAEPQPEARARSVSEALFAAAPGAVVATTATAAASAESARLHLPLLVTGQDAGDAVAAELRRLSADWVVPVGRVPAEALAGLQRVPVGRAAPAPASRPARRPVVVLADARSDAAAAATARAAGATLVPAGTADLVASPKVVTALSTPRGGVVLVGSAFAGRRGLDWAVRAASSGFQLPGGGQRPFAARRFVALYGAPGAPVLGVLGRQGVEATIRRAEQQADDYRRLSREPVVPALELIATVAAGAPGSDGNYSNELPVSRLRPYVEAAARAHQSVLLDLQPGRCDFLSQAKRYQSLLERPNVGLALDPEWRLGPHERPLVRIGSVGADEVNRVSAWLDDVVKRRGLPPKMFVLHQFRRSMLPDRSRIALRPELATLIHVDGQGGQPDKQETWRTLHEDAPKGVAWGWKNFLVKDHPVLTPEQTMREVRPTPALITYQ